MTDKRRYGITDEMHMSRMLATSVPLEDVAVIYGITPAAVLAHVRHYRDLDPRIREYSGRYCSRAPLTSPKNKGYDRPA